MVDPSSELHFGRCLIALEMMTNSHSDDEMQMFPLAIVFGLHLLYDMVVVIYRKVTIKVGGLEVEVI